MAHIFDANSSDAVEIRQIFGDVRIRLATSVSSPVPPTRGIWLLLKRSWPKPRLMALAKQQSMRL